MSDHPIQYTKSRSTSKRKRPRGSAVATHSRASENASNNKNERFHGAFRGGFSAGHFNTVGSSRGWKPEDSNENDIDNDNDELEQEEEYDGGGFGNILTTSSKLKKKQKRHRMQRVEDYMDDEDANEWGGPSSIHADYNQSNHNHQTYKEDGKRGVTAKAEVGGVLDTDTHEHVKDAASIGILLGDDDTSGGVSMSKRFSTMRNTPTMSIGKQLLRRLGWRENRIDSDRNDGTSKKHSGDNKNERNSNISISYAYVPLQEGEDEFDQKSDKEKSLLCRKRLKRIELKLTASASSTLPPPKTETHGIGYEPFQNAPEFKLHHERRKQRAKHRAMAATSTHGDNRTNVYRTSDLYGDEDGEEEEDGIGFERGSSGRRMRSSNTNRPKSDDCKLTRGLTDGDSGDDVLAYEATEDFVGAKTVGGFALHDDDDDVYDQRHGLGFGIDKKDSLVSKASKLKVDENEYQNEIYEASDSDGEDFPATSMQHNHESASSQVNKNIVEKKNNKAVNVFAGALNAWATGTTNIGAEIDTKPQKVVAAITSDGHLVMKGYTLGGDSGTSSSKERYPGPQPPSNYEPIRHEFDQSDAMIHMKIKSSQMRMDMKSHRRSEVSAAAANTQKAPSAYNRGIQRDLKPMAGPSFAALSNSLKDRFTGGSSSTSVAQDANDKRNHKAPLDPPTRVKVTRTTTAWQPSPLLCKRFKVNVPRVSMGGTMKPNVRKTLPSGSREESFFREQVLGQLAKNKNLSKNLEGKGGSRQNGKNRNEEKNSYELFDGGMNASDIERPTMEYMKSIFEPESNDDMSISDEDEDEDEDDDDDVGSDKFSGAKNNVISTKSQGAKLAVDDILEETTTTNDGAPVQDSKISPQDQKKYDDDSVVSSTLSSGSRERRRRKKDKKRRLKYKNESKEGRQRRDRGGSRKRKKEKKRR